MEDPMEPYYDGPAADGYDEPRYGPAEDGWGPAEVLSGDGEHAEDCCCSRCEQPRLQRMLKVMHARKTAAASLEAEQERRQAGAEILAEQARAHDEQEIAGEAIAQARDMTEAAASAAQDHMAAIEAVNDAIQRAVLSSLHPGLAGGGASERTYREAVVEAGGAKIRVREIRPGVWVPAWLPVPDPECACDGQGFKTPEAHDRDCPLRPALAGQAAEVVKPADPLAELLDELNATMFDSPFLDESELPQAEATPEGKCTRCHLGTDLGRGLCYYCRLSDQESAARRPPAPDKAAITRDRAAIIRAQGREYRRRARLATIKDGVQFTGVVLVILYVLWMAVVIFQIAFNHGSGAGH